MTTIIVQLTMPLKIRETLDAYAKSLGISRSEAVRKLVLDRVPVSVGESKDIEG